MGRYSGRWIAYDDRKNGTFERHTYDPLHPERLSRPFLEKTFEDCDDHITFITEDASRAIWIGTYANGINRYDPITKKITHYGIGKEKTGGFTDKSGWAAFNSCDGVLWMSTWQGSLYKIDPLRNIMPHYTTGEPVLAIQEDNAGKVWWGTPHGLFCKERNKTIIKHFVHDPDNPKSLSNDVVQTIYQDIQGKTWIGTGGSGLDLFDPKSQEFISYKSNDANKNSITNNHIYTICNDKEKTLWIGTQNGLNQMNIETGDFIQYQHNPADTNSLGNVWINCLLKEDTGLWVGCWGLDLLNLETGKFKHYLTGVGIGSFCKDSEGVIWATSNFGLFRFNRSSDQFKPFTLPGTGVQIGYIYAVLEDDQKNLWGSSSMGIIRINSKRNEIKIYGGSYGVDPAGLHNDSYPVVCSKSNSGELFFVDATGYYSFFPNQIKSNPTPPQIILTGFSIREKQIKPDVNGPLTEPLSTIKEIRLKYDQNIFTFEFTAIHYSSPEDNRQIFMLENSDKTWRKGNGEQTAYYNNIPPGKYVFPVRAFNSDGAWMEKAISIVISPPWWSTWWAYCLYGLLAGSIIYSLYRTRMNQLEKAQAAQIKAMVATQEDERKRISRDLHDDVGTKLSALKFFLSSLHEKASLNNDEEIKSLAQSSEQFITEAMQDVRQLLLNLSPTILEEFGYTTAIEGLVNKINETKQINFSLVIFGMQGRLLKDYELALYRITQELINNVLKHAEAKHVSLQIGQRDEKIILMMEDDGKGFDIHTHKDGYGLHNLAARTKLMHGTMIIDSKIGKGTSVLIEVPYNFGEI